ncbi:MAG: hypothetical protein WBG43_03085 [Marinifilaceae bacterium]
MNDNIGDILKQKSNPKLRDSFEDDLMLLIHERAASKYCSVNIVKRMYIFVVLGVIVGIIVGVVASFYLNGVVISLGDYSISINKNFLFMPILVGLLFVFEKAYNIYLFRKRSNNLNTLYKVQ